MNYLIHHAPDIEPQIQTCLLASQAVDVPCAPDCEACADRLAAHKPALPLWATAEYEPERISPETIAKIRELWEEFYRKEYEDLIAERDKKILKAAMDFILYGYYEVVIDDRDAKS